ncbi:MAG: heavy-metal-associated domain-containing protein [Ruminococcaceae bacterium]|nr:heavy-metal-associated domain-containing protein [Oscillospiraceae bacterium]
MAKKRIMIEGMSCSHCSSRVENALNALDGVKAKVNLKKKFAEVRADETVSDSLLREAVETLGFTVVEIE